MSSKQRVGIYGGTFNPPHIGHVNAAEKFVSVVNLDELLIMPDFLPPHKAFDVDISPNDRLRMCELAFSNIPKAVVSDLEINRGGKSYTALTLAELQAEDKELYFLCGTDMFLTLEQWYSFETIFKLAVICYVRREEDPEINSKINECKKRYEEKYSARIIPVPVSVVDISSSELRRFLKFDSGENKFFPDNVYEYIKKTGLYK